MPSDNQTKPSDNQTKTIRESDKTIIQSDKTIRQSPSVLYGQEPPSGESTTTECGFNYQLLAVTY